MSPQLPADVVAEEEEDTAAVLVQILKEVCPDGFDQLTAEDVVHRAETVLQKLLDSTQSTPTYCSALAQFVQLHPTLVEPHLPAIFGAVMVGPEADAELKEATADLVVVITELMFRLQRFPKLVAHLLIHLRTCLFSGAPGEAVLWSMPEKVEVKMSQIVTLLPSGQVLETWRCLHHNLAEESVQRVMDGDYGPETVSFLEANVTIFGLLLMNAKVVDASVPLAIATSVSDYMRKLGVEALSKMGKVLLTREHDVLVTKNFLHLAFCWGELHILLKRLSHTYSGLQGIGNAPGTFSFHPIHPYMNAEEWTLLGNRVGNFGEAPCLQLWSKLTVQTLKAMHLFGSPVSHPPMNFLLNNLEVCSLVLCRDLTFLSHHLSSPQILQICRHATRQFVHGCPEWTNLIRNNPEFKEDRDLLSGMLFHALQGSVAKLGRKQGKPHLSKMVVEALDGIKVMEAGRVMDDFYHDASWSWLMDVASVANSDAEELSGLNRSSIQPYLDMILNLPLSHLSPPLKVLTFLSVLSIKRDIAELDIEVFGKLESILAGVMDGREPPVCHFLDGASILWLARHDGQQNETRNFMLERVVKQGVKTQRFLCSLKGAVKELSQWMKAGGCEGTYGEVTILLTKALHGETTRKKTPVRRRKRCARHFKSLQKGFMKMAEVNTEPTPEAARTELMLGFAFLMDKELLEEDGKAMLTGVVNRAFDNPGPVASMFLESICRNFESLSDSLPSDFKTKLCNSNVQGVHVYQVLYRDTPILMRTLSRYYEMLEQAYATPATPPDLSEYASFWTQILTTNLLTEDGVKCVSVALHKIIPQAQMVLSESRPDAEYLRKVISPLLQLQAAAVGVHKLHLFPEVVCMTLHTAASIPLADMSDLGFHDAFRDLCLLWNNLLLHRDTLVHERIPAYMQGVHQCIVALAQRSCQQRQADDLNAILECPPHLERVCTLIRRHPTEFCKTAPYSIGVIAKQFETYTMHPELKERVARMMHSFLDICDEHGITMLDNSLPAATREVFKAEYDNYVKYFKYEGRV